MGGHFYIMPFPGFPRFIWSHDHHVKWMVTMWDKSYCPWQRQAAPPTVVLPDFSARNPHPFWLHFAPTSEGSQPVWSKWGRLGQARKGRPMVPSGKLTQLWKITIFNGKTHYKWPFSIAMLNYQRVLKSTSLAAKPTTFSGRHFHCSVYAGRWEILTSPARLDELGWIQLRSCWGSMEV